MSTIPAIENPSVIWCPLGPDAVSHPQNETLSPKAKPGCTQSEAAPPQSEVIPCSVKRRLGRRRYGWSATLSRRGAGSEAGGPPLVTENRVADYGQSSFTVHGAAFTG
jgi:hypothetical protein